MQAHVFLVYVSLSTDITGQGKERSALIKCPTLHPHTHAVRIKIDFYFRTCTLVTAIRGVYILMEHLRKR